jgi:hypothetical protein
LLRLRFGAFTANSLPHKEFSKIGNKVFIPTGVKNSIFNQAIITVCHCVQGRQEEGFQEVQSPGILANALHMSPEQNPPGADIHLQ